MRFWWVALVVGCESTPQQPIDAPSMIADAAIDALVDATGTCGMESDCLGSRCLLCCGMLGTCYTQCGAYQPNTPCGNIACDPAVPTCLRGDRTPGTCQPFEIVPNLTNYRCE